MGNLPSQGAFLWKECLAVYAHFMCALYKACITITLILPYKRVQGRELSLCVSLLDYHWIVTLCGSVYDSNSSGHG